MRFALASQCHPHASVDAIRAISRCVGLGHRVSFEIVKPNHSAAILSHGDLLLSCVPFSFPDIGSARYAMTLVVVLSVW